MTQDVVSFDSIFQRLCETGDTVADGAAFEELCCWFLRNAAPWKDTFDAVWCWRELKWGRDIGVDIVARHRDQTCFAIKCRRISGSLLKMHADAFLAASQNGFSERILIALASEVSPVVANLLKCQKVPVRLILRDDLVGAHLDWSPWADGADRPRRAVLPPPPRPPLGGRFLTEEQILAWADEHRRRTGKWPVCLNGPVVGATSGETWKSVNGALSVGCRGLPGGSSLAKLLFKRRGIRNVKALSKLTEEQILVWADEHHRRTGEWPIIACKPVTGAQGETWTGVNAALFSGCRGLPGGSSLPKLLFARRGVVKHRRKPLPTLPEERILAWADEHHRRTGCWPSENSGIIAAATKRMTWAAVSTALREGCWGLPGGSSLAKLLAARRGKRNGSALPKLTEEQILVWADEQHRRTGRWPSGKGGLVAGGNGETWGGLNIALSRGHRGLPGGSSLAKLLFARRGIKPRTGQNVGNTQ